MKTENKNNKYVVLKRFFIYNIDFLLKHKMQSWELNLEFQVLSLIHHYTIQRTSYVNELQFISH
jgi:hypothetical protein